MSAPHVCTSRCWSLPLVLRVHRDEKDKPMRGPYCPVLSRPRIVITDDPRDRSVLPPGEKFADAPGPGRFWSA